MYGTFPKACNSRECKGRQRAALSYFYPLHLAKMGRWRAGAKRKRDGGASSVEGPSVTPAARHLPKSSIYGG